MSSTPSPNQLGFEELWTEEEAAKIPGNSPAQVKQRIANVLSHMGHSGGRLFGGSIARRIQVTEVSVNEKAEDSVKMEGRVVCEIETAPDMLNANGAVHGGCTAFLIDICSSMPSFALDMHNGLPGRLTVSQSLYVVYHGPALLGDKLRLVSTTTAIGARIQTLQCEIWNVTQHRLVATGVHVKMPASTPKVKSSL